MFILCSRIVLIIVNRFLIFFLIYKEFVNMNRVSCKYKIGIYIVFFVCFKLYFFRVKIFRIDEVVLERLIYILFKVCILI